MVQVLIIAGSQSDSAIVQKSTDFPDIPLIFQLIREIGSIALAEMFTTFNMGIGMIIVVSEKDSERALEILSSLDESYKLGRVEKAQEGTVVIEPHGVTLK